MSKPGEFVGGCGSAVNVGDECQDKERQQDDGKGVLPDEVDEISKVVWTVGLPGRMRCPAFAQEDAKYDERCELEHGRLPVDEDGVQKCAGVEIACERDRRDAVRGQHLVKRGASGGDVAEGRRQITSSKGENESVVLEKTAASGRRTHGRWDAGVWRSELLHFIPWRALSPFLRL